MGEKLGSEKSQYLYEELINELSRLLLFMFKKNRRYNKCDICTQPHVHPQGESNMPSNSELRAFKVGINVMRKPALCICGNKSAGQLCSDHIVDQRLCSRDYRSTS